MGNAKKKKKKTLEMNIKRITKENKAQFWDPE